MSLGDCMAKSKAAIDTGPLMHFCELEKHGLLRDIAELHTTAEVFNELSDNHQNLVKPFLRLHDLTEQQKNVTKFLVERFELQMGEATAISLAKGENIGLFLTDDLAARIIAKRMGLEPHGTLGMLVRAFRIGVLSKSETIALLHKLPSTTLFITTDLIQWAVKEVNQYPKT